MVYFSGFSLQNEGELFPHILLPDNSTVAGFSYGAIQAFQNVLESGKRVDRLVLISPAFFQTMDKKEKKLQLIFFGRDPKSYTETFYKNCLYPSSADISKYRKEGTKDALKDLLEFVWKEEDLKTIVERGTKIEVHLGEQDKIVDSHAVKEFFKNYATVYFYKNRGHLLI